MQNIFSIFYVVRMLVGTKQLYTQKWFKKNSKCPLRPLVTLGQCCIWSFLIFGQFWSKVLAHEWSEIIKTVNKERSFIAFVNMYMYRNNFCGFRNYLNKKVNRKVQGVPKSQTAANYQEAEKRTNTNMCKANKQMHEKHKDQLPLPQARCSQC